MAHQDPSLQNHIDRVLAFKSQQNSEKLTLEELKELDMSMGMTEKQWEAMMQGARDSLMMAENHLRNNNAEDAIEAAESCVAINPYIAQAYIVIAKSCILQWKASASVDALAKAEHNAQECLALDPQNRDAYSVLAQCNAANNTVTDNKKKSNLILIISTAAIVIIGLIVLNRSCSNSKQTNNVLIQQEEQLRSAEAQLVNVIERRNSLISNLLPLATADGRETVVDDIETQVRECAETTNGSPEYYECQHDLTVKLSQVARLIDASDKAAATYIIQLEGAENRIAVEKKRLNDAIASYNTLVRTTDDAGSYEPRPYIQ